MASQGGDSHWGSPLRIARYKEGGFMRFVTEFFRDLRTSLYRNAIFLMANTVVASGIGFFFWMVVARYYTPYEVGLAATIIPVVAFLGMLSRF